MATGEAETIEIVVNGETRQVPAGRTISGLLDLFSLDPSRVAIELDRVIIRKPEWGSTAVHAGAQIEIVQFVGGG